MKQSIEKCLSEYTTRELITFHANLNALFLCCTEDFHLLPLLMRVHLAIKGRNDLLSEAYLQEVDKVINSPEG